MVSGGDRWRMTGITVDKVGTTVNLYPASYSGITFYKGESHA